MISRRKILFLLLLTVVLSDGFAFPPVTVVGSDLDLFINPIATGDIAATTVGGIRFALSWREHIDRGGYVSLDGRLGVRSSLSGELALSDSEEVSVELGLPVGTDELVVGAGMSSSFLLNGTARALLETSWSADYRFSTQSGWMGFVSNGRYRFSESDADDMLAQDAGVGLLVAPSVRLSTEASLCAGYELWPDDPVFDNTGSPTGERRRDVTVELDTDFRGLWGYFTTWSAGGLAGLRLSNANRFVNETGELQPDSENRITGELSAGLCSSPTREFGISVSAAVRDTWYYGRAAGASDGSDSNRLSTSVVLGSDYNPADGLFVVASLSGLATISSDSSQVGWSLRAGIGVEYSF